MPFNVPGTATIGVPLRSETEVVRGETLIVSMQVPGGTAGKSYASAFRHEAGAASTASFTVTIFADRIVLSTPTGSLLLGRYLYDVTSATASVPPVVSTSRLREFVVLAGVTQAGAGGGVLPPPGNSDASALISTHNNDPAAHGGLTGSGNADYEATFTDSDLSTAGVLVMQHGLPSRPSGLLVYDSDGYVVDPSRLRLSATSIELELTDFQPLQGMWRISAIK